MSNMLRIVVIGDRVQPSALTADALAAAIRGPVSVDAFDWLEEGGGFAGAALASERGEAVTLPQAWKAALLHADVLVTHFFPVRRSVLDQAPRLRLLATLRHGQENLDLEAAAEHGVAVVNNPGREAEPVSDFAVLLVLEALRGLVGASTAMREDGWIDPDLVAVRARNVTASTIGIVGFGYVGQLVCRKLGVFGGRRLGVDPLVDGGTIRAAGAEPTDLPHLLRVSDVVTLHARLTPETRGLIGERELRLMRPTATLVNTARAELVDESALVAALETGVIAGASLDVFWEEPLPNDHPLRSMERVLISPHIAGSTKDAQRTSAELLARRVAERIDALALPSEAVGT